MNPREMTGGRMAVVMGGGVTTLALTVAGGGTAVFKVTHDAHLAIAVAVITGILNIVALVCGVVAINAPHRTLRPLIKSDAHARKLITRAMVSEENEALRRDTREILAADHPWRYPDELKEMLAIVCAAETAAAKPARKVARRATQAKITKLRPTAGDPPGRGSSQ